MKRLPLIGIALLSLIACQSPLSASPRSTAANNGSQASPAASPHSRELLFAVLTTEGGDPGHGANRVALVGIDCKTRAAAMFAPRHIPVFGRAATLLQPEARVSNDGVYYADAQGVVRALT